MFSSIQILGIMASHNAKFHEPKASLEDELRRFKESKYCLAADVAKHLPDDADSVYHYLLEGRSPQLVEYAVCTNCGKVKRKALRDAVQCECGKPWEVDSMKLSVFPVHLWLQRLFENAYLAKEFTSTLCVTPDGNDGTDGALESELHIYDYFNMTWWTELTKLRGDIVDPNFLKVMSFMDSMVLDKNSNNPRSIKVMLLSFFNWAQHLRYRPGFCIPYFVIDRKLPTTQYILAILADELGYISTVGLQLFNADTKRTVVLRGDLMRIGMDGRGITDMIGYGEAGRNRYSCLFCDTRGYTLVDFTGRTQGNESRCFINFGVK